MNSNFFGFPSYLVWRYRIRWVRIWLCLFFFLTNGKYSVSKKFRLSFCQLIFCRLSCYIVELFFCCSQCMIKFKAFHENVFIFGSTGLTQVLSTQLPLDKYSRIFFERRRLCFWTSFSQIDHHSKKNLKL